MCIHTNKRPMARTVCEIQCRAETCDDAPVMFKPQLDRFLVSATIFLRDESLETKHELLSVRSIRYWYQYETFFATSGP